MVVYSDLGRYGAGRVMATVASGLASRGHRVEVVTFTPEASRHPMRDRRWTLTILSGNAAARPWVLWRLLRRRRPSAVLLADHRFAAAATLLARLACPGATIAPVLHCDPEGVLRAGRHMTPARLRMWRAFLTLSVGRATKVIAVSNGVRARAAQWLRIPPARIVTIYNPVLSAARSRGTGQPTGLPWVDTPDRPVVLGVGRLSHEKDWGTLLAAFDLLRRRMQVRLVILGDGPDRERLEGAVSRLGLGSAAMLLGEVPDAGPFMARADVLAHCAVTEGLGNVLVEALAVGLPVVAADCPVGPAEVLDGGRWGTLVPVGNPEAMAMALEDAIRRGRAPSDATQFVWSRFGSEPIFELYERVLQPHRRAAPGHGAPQAPDREDPATGAAHLGHVAP